MDGFEDREPDRPGFVTSDENGNTYKARCVVTGKQIAYFPSNTKTKRQSASRTSVAFALLCVTALVGGVFVFRSQYLYPQYGADNANQIAGALNSAQVIFDVYTYLPLALLPASGLVLTTLSHPPFSHARPAPTVSDHHRQHPH
jgi:hypothetical protein